MKEKRNWLLFAFCLLLPLVLGSIVGFITKGAMDYAQLVQPSFAPPGWLFPVVWTILYLLMGISSYLIWTSHHPDKNKALFVFYLQLFVNLLWSIIFFVWKLRLFAFFWIVLLIVLVIWMISLFFKIDQKAAKLQLPYLVWIVFAAFLNLVIYFLN